MKTSLFFVPVSSDLLFFSHEKSKDNKQKGLANMVALVAHYEINTLPLMLLFVCINQDLSSSQRTDVQHFQRHHQ